MLAPATPHIAEEFRSKIGGKEMVSELVINELDVNDQDITHLAKENYLRNLIDSSRNVKGLAQRHSDIPISSGVIQTAASWKNILASEAINLSLNNFDFKKNGIDYLKSLDIFSEEKLRGEIFQTWQSLTIGNKKNRGKIYTWSEGDISLISSQFDETNLINNNAIFIANALSVDTVISYKVGDGEDVAGKARVASPLEPGIAFI
jgi:leucyl-tRNA synthetase